MDTNQQFTDTCIYITHTIFAIKHKITHNEYLSIMKQLTNIRTQYTYLYEKTPRRECDCVLNSNTFCCATIKQFQNCKNLNYIITKCPIMRNIIIIDVLPEKCEYTYQMFYKTDINFSLNIQFLDDNDNNNTDNTDINDSDTMLCVKLIKNMLNLEKKNKKDLYKIFMCIAIYSYIFKNFKVFVRHDNFIDIIYNKLIDLSNKNSLEALLCFKIMQQLYNINTNIFKIFLQNLKPHYIYKKVLVQFNKQEHKLKHIIIPLYVKQTQYKHNMILRSHVKK